LLLLVGPSGQIFFGVLAMVSQLFWQWINMTNNKSKRIAKRARQRTAHQLWRQEEEIRVLREQQALLADAGTADFVERRIETTRSVASKDAIDSILDAVLDSPADSSSPADKSNSILDFSEASISNASSEPALKAVSFAADVVSAATNVVLGTLPQDHGTPSNFATDHLAEAATVSPAVQMVRPGTLASLLTPKLISELMENVKLMCGQTEGTMGLGLWIGSIKFCTAQFGKYWGMSKLGLHYSNKCSAKDNSISCGPHFYQSLQADLISEINWSRKMVIPSHLSNISPVAMAGLLVLGLGPLLSGIHVPFEIETPHQQVQITFLKWAKTYGDANLTQAAIVCTHNQRSVLSCVPVPHTLQVTPQTMAMLPFHVLAAIVPQTGESLPTPSKRDFVRIASANVPLLSGDGKGSISSGSDEDLPALGLKQLATEWESGAAADKPTFRKPPHASTKSASTEPTPASTKAASAGSDVEW